MRHDKFRTVLRSTVGAVILMPALAFAQSNSGQSNPGSPSGQGTQTSGSRAQGSGSEETTKQGSRAQGSSSRGSAGQGSQTSDSSGASGTSSSASQTGTMGGTQSSATQSSGMQSGSQGRASSGSSSARQSIDPAEVQRVFGSDATVIDLQSLGTEQIRAVQQSLQDRGHYKGPIDGVYGPQTRAGVKAMLSQQNSLNQRLINQGQITGPLAASMGISQTDITPVSGTDARSGQGSSIRSQPSTPGMAPSGTSTGSGNTGSSSSSGSGRSGSSSPSGSSSSGNSSSGSTGSAGSSSAAPSGSQYPR